jgi:F-type H+-transporting ATPase subunit epsilon
MRLRVLLPNEILIDSEVTKVSAEAENGAFTLLPRHISFVTALPPGIISFTTPTGEEEFIAVDEGVLVKCGSDVQASVRNAVIGHELGELKRLIQERFRHIDEHERKARDALYKLEADLVRRFVELGQFGH